MWSQELPLTGVRVLDLSQGIAGPYSTKLMAHLGAEVIKIERPSTGDVTRAIPPFYQDKAHPDTSGLFLYLNLGKKGVTLNLAHRAGRGLMKELAKSAQVMVEGFTPGTQDSRGCGYASLEVINPSLVLASITPFGQTGPYRDYADSDLVLQALGGLIYTTGSPDREPLKIGGNPAYYLAAVHAFSGIMGALWYAERAGAGQHLDIAIVECMAQNAIYSSLSFDLTGQVLKRQEDRTPVFQTRDGYVGFMMRQQNWPELCRILDRPEWEGDPRFADEPARQQHRKELNQAVEVAVRELEKAKVYHQAQEQRIPAGYVCTAPDLLASPQYQDREFFETVDHPATGTLTYPGVPWKMGDLPSAMGRAPLLGEHNEEILGGQLGLSSRKLATLKKQCTI